MTKAKCSCGQDLFKQLEDLTLRLAILEDRVQKLLEAISALSQEGSTCRP